MNTATNAIDTDLPMWAACVQFYDPTRDFDHDKGMTVLALPGVRATTLPEAKEQLLAYVKKFYPFAKNVDFHADHKGRATPRKVS